MITTFRTTVHGRTVELPWDLGLPEGHVVEVTIKTRPEFESPPEPPLPRWLARLEINPEVALGKFIVKGTRLRADALVELLEAGKSEEELLHTYSELAAEDMEAVREYARLPMEMRRLIGAWAEDAEELDKYLEWNRQQRRRSRPPGATAGMSVGGWLPDDELTQQWQEFVQQYRAECDAADRERLL